MLGAALGLGASELLRARLAESRVSMPKRGHAEALLADADLVHRSCVQMSPAPKKAAPKKAAAKKAPAKKKAAPKKKTPLQDSAASNAPADADSMDVEDNSDQPLAAASSAQDSGKSIEEMYQKKTQLEHILLRPDTVRFICASADLVASAAAVLTSACCALRSTSVQLR
jgi:hypothetical protein